MDIQRRISPRHIGHVFSAIALLIAMPAVGQVTIDFTTFSGGNLLLNDWEWTFDVDGSGNVTATNVDNANVDAGNPIDIIPVNVSGGVTVSGTLNAGFNESFKMIIDGTNSAGNDTQVRIDGDGTGLGVQGRNSGRIEWQFSDPDTEQMTIDLNLMGLSSGTLTMTEIGIVSYTGQPVVAAEDFSGGQVFTNEDESRPSSLALTGDYDLNAGFLDQMILSVRDIPVPDDGDPNVFGYAVGSITFDLVPGPDNPFGEGDYGDYNDDGVVDAADYTVYRDQLASSPDTSLPFNDATVGSVDNTDYQIWSDFYGTSNPAATTVPEPATFFTVGVAIGLLASRRCV